MDMISKIKVGDIFEHTWGYDQTNADFYQVVGKTAKSIKVRKIKTKEKSDGGQSMTGTSYPQKNNWDGKVMIKRPYEYNGEPLIRINDYTAGASPWKGNGIAVSHYA